MDEDVSGTTHSYKEMNINTSKKYLYERECIPGGRVPDGVRVD
jgi:hypothetical protein